MGAEDMPFEKLVVIGAWAPYGSSGLLRCQGNSPWAEGRRRALRGVGDLWIVHPQQTEAPDEAQQAHEHKPQKGSLPPPFTLRHVPPHDPWHAPPQAIPWVCCIPACEVPGGCPRAIQLDQEGRRPRCSADPAPPTWPQILQPWQTCW